MGGESMQGSAVDGQERYSVFRGHPVVLWDPYVVEDKHARFLCAEWFVGWFL